MMTLQRLRDAYDDARAITRDTLYAIGKAREFARDWIDDLRQRAELEESELGTVRFHRGMREHGRRMIESAKRLPIKVPPSNAATKTLLATLRTGDRVLLSNGETRTVLEAPRVINGWEMVKTTPAKGHRVSSHDPNFAYWPLVQVVARVADALDDAPTPDDDSGDDFDDDEDDDSDVGAS